MAYNSTRSIGNGTTTYPTDIVKKDFLKGKKPKAATRTVARALKKKKPPIKK